MNYYIILEIECLFFGGVTLIHRPVSYKQSTTFRNLDLLAALRWDVPTQLGPSEANGSQCIGGFWKY